MAKSRFFAFFIELLPAGVGRFENDWKSVSSYLNAAPSTAG